MTSKTQRRMALRRKFHILRTLTKSRSVKRSSIVMDAFLYICKLKLQVEAIKREHQYLTNNIQEVKVEKHGTGYLVKVTCNICKEDQDMLFSILEVFEKMNLNVLQATVSCKHFFRLEANVEAQGEAIDSEILTEAILKVIDK